MQNFDLGNLDKLLAGSIDMHLHVGPDELPMRGDALEIANQAADAQMKAIVLKNHSSPTTPVAALAQEYVPEITTAGSICLDYEIGGLNADALEKQAMFGVKVVWMPTFSAINSRSKMKEMGLNLNGDGFSIIDSAGKLVPQIDPILEIIKSYNMVLASGHISPKETFALVEEAKKRHIDKIVLTHPLDSEIMAEPFTIDDLKTLAKMGAFIEQTLVTMLPTELCLSPQERVRNVHAIGAEYFVMGTDLGQFWNIPPTEGMRFFIAILLRNGMLEKEIEIMAKENPSGLLGLS